MYKIKCSYCYDCNIIKSNEHEPLSFLHYETKQFTLYKKKEEQQSQ